LKKIYLLSLASIFLGITAGYFSQEFIKIEIADQYLSEILINIALFMVIPIITFSVAVSLNSILLREKLLPLILKYLQKSLIIITIIAVIALILALFLPFTRIPIIIEEAEAVKFFTLKEILSSFFPSSFFMVFANQKIPLIHPVYLISILIGLGFTINKRLTQNALLFFESFYHVLLHINSFILKLFPVIYFVMSYFLVIYWKKLTDLTLFKALLINSLIFTTVVFFILFPGYLFFHCKKRKPYNFLFSQIIIPSIPALLTHNVLMTLPILYRQSRMPGELKEDKKNILAPLFITLIRPGSIGIGIISFITILRSYVSLDLTLFHLLWVLLFTIVYSFVLNFYPSSGLSTLIIMLCLIYQRGMESGYLILNPVFPLLLCLAAFIDVGSNLLILSDMGDAKENASN